MKTIILATEEIQQINSKAPKILYEILGKPVLSYVIDAAKQLGSEEIITVLGTNIEAVRAKTADSCILVEQKESLSAADAILAAANYIDTTDQVLVLNGNTPLLTKDTLQYLLNAHITQSNAVTSVSTALDASTGYNQAVYGNKETSAGVYVFQSQSLKSALTMLKNKNPNGNYKLTDILDIIAEQGLATGVLIAEDYDEFSAVHSKIQLHDATRVIKERINRKHMENGVTIVDTTQTFISPDVIIGEDTIIYPGAILEGVTKIGTDCLIGPNSRVVDSTIGDGVEVEYSVVLESTVGDKTVVGPFAYIRPHSVIGEDCKVGDFVEVKNSIIGNHTKASHLTYIGDSDVGNNINFGCGTVTVNYDGQFKHRTVIKDNAFIGCNSNLVAPVTIEEGAFIAAGSTITDDIPSENLAIARARQINKSNWKKSN